MTKSLLLITVASLLFACSHSTSGPYGTPTTVVVKISPPALGPAGVYHVTSSPPGIDCTNDGTTTSGTCEMTVTTPSAVVLSPNSDSLVVWSDESGMSVWAGAAVDAGGKNPNWATIFLNGDGPSRRTFTVAYVD